MRKKLGREREREGGESLKLEERDNNIDKRPRR
jgi:hypothetical protein